MSEKFCCLVLIVDKSGSMCSIRNDAIGGFNSFIEEQKKVPGKAVMTTAFFDTEYELIHDWKNLQKVKKITLEDYVPGGCTALYDAIARTIMTVGLRINELDDVLKPEKVIVGILTDGEENSSSDYKGIDGRQKIAEMIKHQTEKYSWEFHYLAANQNAFEVGANLNIQTVNIAHFAATGKGVRSAYKGVSDSYTSSRTN